MWSLVSLFVWIDGLLSAETFGGPFYNQNRRPRATTKCLPLSEEEGEGNTHQQPRNIIIAPPSAVIPSPPFCPSSFHSPADGIQVGKERKNRDTASMEESRSWRREATLGWLPCRSPPLFFVFMICTRHLPPLPSFLWKRAGGALVLSLPFFFTRARFIGGLDGAFSLIVCL